MRATRAILFMSRCMLMRDYRDGRDYGLKAATMRPLFTFQLTSPKLLIYAAAIINATVTEHAATFPQHAFDILFNAHDIYTHAQRGLRGEHCALLISAARDMLTYLKCHIYWAWAAQYKNGNVKCHVHTYVNTFVIAHRVEPRATLKFHNEILYFERES